MLGRITAFVYGASCYALSLATFAYMFCFIGNFWLSKSIDSGTQTPFLRALASNILLIGVFGLQHTVMARPGLSSGVPVVTTWDSFTPGHDEFGMPKPAYGDEKMPVFDPDDLRSSSRNPPAPKR